MSLTRMTDTRRTVAVILAWQVAASVCYYSVFAATGLIQSGFSLSKFSLGLVVSTLTLGYTLFLFPMGAAVDGLGEKRVMTAGLVALAFGVLGVTLASSFAFLLGAVFALGAAYATAMPSTNRAIVEKVPNSKRNLALGIKQVGVSAGAGASALVVTGLAARAGVPWDAGFYVAAGLAFLVTAAFSQGYRDGSAGTGALAIPDVRGLADNRAYVLLIVGGVFLAATLFTMTGYLVPYLTESISISVGVAGLTLALVQVMGSTGRIAFGGLADRLPGESVRGSALIMVVLALCSAALFFLLPLADARLTAIAVFALLGLSVLGFTGLYHASVTMLVAPDEVGAATAGAQTALNSGALVIPPLFGYVADVNGYAAGWRVLVVFALVAALFFGGVVRQTA
ncbi:MFS transporter [Haladaptatus sp. ZSTT2]|uniref:MFS transporter n=1 Tax=Haladaptatus sp. ZSTT2 TaxID=3120515 RepID=UPI00300E8707